MVRFITSEPPPTTGVRRSFVEARGVRFHVTETGPADGRAVLALHGWPQHHWEYRDQLADPPPGMRIIAPETANADYYTVETADPTHFIVDERPDLVRATLIALAEEPSR